MPTTLPPRFVWGAATSAYQIEGAVHADGRGPSIWDHFCRQPGAIRGGDTGEVACDHFHRFAEDIDLLRRLGVDAYRFSISWPRLFPTGEETAALPAGLAFYDRLVDALLEAGITPWLTLYHWDLPQALEEAGGWPARRTVDAFERLARAVVGRLGDRVRHWNTINEPWVAAQLGYAWGVHAPGRRDPSAALAAGHHLLLGHGRAVRFIREGSPGAQVGIVLNMTDFEPASPSVADADATRRADGTLNRWYLDPVFRGAYPEDAIADLRADGLLPEGPLPFVQEGDMETIAAPTDLLGINYYSRGVVRSDRVPEAENLPRTVPPPRPEQLTAFGWEIHPESLTRLLRRVTRDYGPPALYITENGASYGDGPDAEGRIADDRRIAYLEGHLEAAALAIEEGVPLSGYFAWSLLDNFEWAEGFHQRFGLVWVDFATGQRLPKDSFFWYRQRILAHRESVG